MSSLQTIHQVGGDESFDDGREEGGAIAQVTPSVAAIVLFFGSIIFATAAMTARIALAGDFRALRHATMLPRSSSVIASQPLQISFISLYTLLCRTSLFALLLLVCYLLEFHPVHPHAERDQEFDADYFWFIVILFTGVCVFSVSRNDGRNMHIETTCLDRDASLQSSSARTLHNDLGKILGSENKNGIDQKSDLIGNNNKVSLPRNSGMSSCCTTASNDGDSKISNTSYVEPMVSQANDLLSRSQTLELKGLCELIFLITQYTHAKTISEYSNLQQLIQSTFLFLSGFSHFHYFYVTNDYSLSRVLRQLFRINMLCVFLCLSQSNPYILYNAIPLHSFYFLMIYFIMKIGSSSNSDGGKNLQQPSPMNASRTEPSSSIASARLNLTSSVILTTLLGIMRNYSKYGLRIKMFILACTIFVIWDLNSGLFQILFVPFFPMGTPIEGAPLGSLWEWYFRSSLHHWAAFVGAVFGANAAITSLFSRRLESYQKGLYPCRALLSRFILGAALVFILCIYLAGPFHFNSYEYNDVNGYFSFLPVLAYIYVRNSTPVLRHHSVGFLRYIGLYSLELYLLHHHLLLTCNGKTVLTLLPGYPKLNLLLVVIIYFSICRMFHALTCELRDMLLPQGNSVACLRSLLTLCCTLLGFFVVALALHQTEMMSLGVIWALILICGILLYQTVMDTTWSCPAINREVVFDSTEHEEHFRGEPNLSATNFVSNNYSSSNPRSGKTFTQQIKESGTAKMSPPLVGSIVIFIIGASWERLASMHPHNSLLGMKTFSARDSSTRLQNEPLSMLCAEFANIGRWVAIDSCSEYQTSLYSSHLKLEKARQSQPMDNPHYLRVSSVSHCASVTEWAWDRVSSISGCRFSYRDVPMLQHSLRHRSLVFLGGTTTRHMYFALCRALGDSSLEAAGQYDPTIAQHTDVIRYFGDTSLEFKWAPLAAEAAAKLKEFHFVGNAGPDVIFLSGGPWDTLHLGAANNIDDLNHHKESVSALAFEMTRLKERQGISTVWLIPPCINTPALNHVDKRLYMSEERVEEMRQLYLELRVLDAATFVLDGQAFTFDKVAESFDGIHYPPYIYDVGAQIFANSLDWVMPQKKFLDEMLETPKLGTLANPFLGVMMLCVCFIGLFFFDGYMGCSYVAALVFTFGSREHDANPGSFTGVMPNELYREAFSVLHAKHKLPRIPLEHNDQVKSFCNGNSA